MTAPTLSVTHVGVPSAPTLVLGPALGTSANSLWGPCMRKLESEFFIVAWDLPGHGESKPSRQRFSIDDLAAAVVSLLDHNPDTAIAPFNYAGNSVGGAVGLSLLLNYPDRVAAAALVGAGATIGSPASWLERAELVRDRGVEAVVDASIGRWFAPRTRNGRDDVIASSAEALRQVDAESYALVCEALALFDVSEQLTNIKAPVTALTGEEDQVTPVSSSTAIAEGIAQGRAGVVSGAAHLSPLEDPDAVCGCIRSLSASDPS